MKTLIHTTTRKSSPASLTAIWQTPIGPLTGAFGENGLLALKFPAPARQTLTRNGPVRVEITQLTWADPDREGDRSLHICLESVTEALQDYFQGKPLANPPMLDWSGAGAFDRAVWEAARQIPPGQTRTYGQIAQAIGFPKAARAVGGALGRNPIILLVPCHRVISTSYGPRRLGGFTGGLALKQYLLDFESRPL
jgi:O-6-methylguanine DNA methyltransferase